MDPSLYRAASEGNVEVLWQFIPKLDIQTTPNKNTALHVAAQFGHLPCVALILKLHPSLLCQVNNKRENPLHVASRGGYPFIVEALIQCSKEGGTAPKEMLKATNVDGDTALHMAVRNHYVEVVKLLTREDPQFSDVANKAYETPLYLAVEGGYNEIAFEILQTCKSPAYGGPLGRTALHSAVIFKPWLREIVAKLLEWKSDLINKADIYGWTPLHYAALYQNFEAVEKLLQMDKSVAYVTSNHIHDKKIALHIAVAHGFVCIMDKILLHCPDCWEIVTSKGQNILHIAVDWAREDATEYILKKSWSSHLINQKDDDGNTPLHLLATSKCETIGLWKDSGKLWNDERADLHAFNNRNMTPHDVELSYYEVDFLLEPQMAGERNAISNYRSNIEKWKYDCREQKRISEEETRVQQEVERKVKIKMKAKEKARLEESVNEIDDAVQGD